MCYLFAYFIPARFVKKKNCFSTFRHQGVLHCNITAKAAELQRIFKNISFSKVASSSHFSFNRSYQEIFKTLFRVMFTTDIYFHTLFNYYNFLKRFLTFFMN